MDATIEVDFRTYAAFKCVCDALVTFPGWTFDPNIDQFLSPKFTKEIPRFFSFNLEKKYFFWQKADSEGNGEETVLTLPEEAIELLDFVKDMAASFEDMPQAMTTEEAIQQENQKSWETAFLKKGENVFTDHYSSLTDGDDSYEGKIDVNAIVEYLSKPQNTKDSYFYEKKYYSYENPYSESYYYKKSFKGLYSTYDETGSMSDPENKIPSELMKTVYEKMKTMKIMYGKHDK